MRAERSKRAAIGAALGGSGGRSRIARRLSPRAVGVELVEHGRQTDAEHLLADGAQQLRHQETPDTREAGLLPGEARTAVDWLQAVGDQRAIVVLAAAPGVPEQERLAHLEHL